MAVLKVKIEGLEKAKNKIKFTRLSVIKAINQEALYTGYDIEATAKQLVRVDTGRLAASINTSARKVNLIAEVEVSTNVEYAFAQEYGDPARPNYGYTPFLFPAYEQHKKEFLKAVKQILQGIK